MKEPNNLNNSNEKFEHPKEFGRWSRIESEDGDSIMFNSSHTYPLKIEDYVNQVHNLVYGREVTPLWIEMRPTDACNQDCIFCGTQDSRKRKRATLSYSQAIKIISQASEEGIKKVRFCGGGDPLLHFGIESFIKTSYSKGLGVMLITNGLALNEARSEAIAPNCHYMRISINGGQNSYSNIHRTELKSFEKVLSNLKNLVKIRREKGLENQLYIGTTYVVMPENCFEIHRTAERLKECGADGVFFRGATVLPNFSDCNRDTIRNERELCKPLKDDNFLIHFAARILNSEANPPVNNTFCYQSLLRMYIEADGNASICGKWAPTLEHSLGNVNKESLKQILGGTPRKEHREIPYLDCDGCDSAYFNKTMDFIQRKIRLGQNYFKRIFDEDPAPTIAENFPH